MGLERAAIACNRFGLGARPGEMADVGGDPQGWLLAQIRPETQPPEALAALPSTADDVTAFRRQLQVRRALQATPSPAGIAPPAAPSASMPAAAAPPPPTTGPTLADRYVAAAGARLRVATASDQPFFERWVRFWSNHFTVSAAKPDCTALPPAFERDVVRRHAAGRFADMLLASCRHPGMQVYLDQVSSIGPDSPAARRAAERGGPPSVRRRGLNENLGREVLELHTLGVRSGYTQADVRALALMLTGWSVRQDGGGPDDLFQFRPQAHEPGPQTLLGRRYPQEDQRQAEAALADLARHPATATHVAAKLARHFIADDPPPAAVARIARAFREGGGDMSLLARAVVRSPEAWDPRLRKYKTPEEFVVSAQRALDVATMPDRQLVGVLTRMGQRPNAPGGPDGWADQEAAWTGADPLWKRMEWAAAASRGLASAGLDPAAVADAALGPQLTSETLRAIRAADSPAQGLSLFLVSPDFQRR